MRSPSALVAETLAEPWRRCLRPADVTTSVQIDVPEFDSLDATLEWLSSEVTLQAIDARSRDLWMLHAAGVADPDTGATVALVGPSGAGKTTASRTLSQRFGYVSDETVGIDATGAVLPYPKPLSVVQPGQLHKRQVSPDELGLFEAPTACRLAGIVLLNRVEGASVDVRAVPLGESLVRLAEQTSYVARIDSPLRTMAAQVERTGGVIEVTYAEADELVPVVRAIMDA